MHVFVANYIDAALGSGEAALTFVILRFMHYNKHFYTHTHIHTLPSPRHCREARRPRP